MHYCVSGNGGIARTTDLISWDTVADARDFYEVARGIDRYVACGSYRSYVLIDGQAAQYYADIKYPFDVIFYQGKFWRVTGQSNKIQTSVDGFTWADITIPLGSVSLSIKASEDIIVVSGVGRICYSLDAGATWTMQSSPAGSNNAIWRLALDGSRLLLNIGYGELFIAEPPYSSWQTVIMSTATTDRPTNAASAKILVNNNTIIIPGLNTTNRYLLSKNAGTTWTVETTPLGSGYSGIVNNGGFIVAHVGGTPKLYQYDIDGENPVEIADLTSLEINICYIAQYEPIVSTPIISPASGTYVDPLEVTITCETEGSVIHYTTNGSEPDEDSPIYTGPIDFRSLDGTGTVKAIAFSPTLPPSSVATVNYIFKLKVFVQPESGGYSDYINCSIRTNHIVPETVVYYTTDGSEPTEASLVYSEPFTITPPYSGEFVVKAFAVNASFVTSDIETESYYYKAPSPIDKASLTLETGLEGFNPITGKFNRLGCSGAVLLSGNLAWELTDTEYELFVGWIAFCGGEESRLTIPMITGDVELPHVVQLLELLSVGTDTGAYSLSANAKIVTRPFPDGFSWEGWAGALYGPPATYPTELPFPQWGFSTAPQALFVATGGVSTAARLRQARGSVMKVSWKLSGAQFDYWLAWFCWSLAFGRRKFSFAQPWLCQFIEDPKLNIDGVNFTVTATLFYAETGT